MRALRHKFDSSARRFLRDQRGSAITMFAVFLMVGAGFAAVVIDGGHLYSLKSKLQTTADAAVLVAVSELPDTDAARTAAIVMAGKNMATGEHGTVLANADVMTGNWDSDTRTFTPAGNPINAVRVVTRRSQANGNAAGLFFARILGFDDVDVETTAIASSSGGGDLCVIALDPSAVGAITVSGGAVVTMACGVMVNSTDDRSIRVTGGGACLTAISITTMGDTMGSCINADEEIETAAPDPIADPLDYLVPPEDLGCDYVAVFEVTVDTVLDPGVYCGGIDINGGPIVDFNPGEYTIKPAFPK